MATDSRLAKWIEEQSRKPVDQRQWPTWWGKRRIRRLEVLRLVSASNNQLLSDLKRML